MSEIMARRDCCWDLCYIMKPVHPLELDVIFKPSISFLSFKGPFKPIIQ